jgi:PPOX class probable F420-dependent enzyme
LAGHVRTLTEPEWRAFLSHGTRTGKLATVRADGRPHVAPVWFVLDGHDVVFNTHSSTVKAANLRRTGLAAICVDDQQAPYGYVTVEGPVTISADPAELVATATRIGARYMGPERGEEFGRRNGVPGELVIRLTPSKVVSFVDMAG